MSTTPVLLVIDDEAGTLTLADRAVASAGYRTILHRSATDALAMLSNEPVDVALVAVRMPELDGLDVLRAIRQLQPECGVILMTGETSVESAIEAIKLGALDCLTRPLDVTRLQQLLHAARDAASRRAELFTSEGATARRLELCGMIGRSAVMQQLFGLIRRLAPHVRTALITGGTGAGKQGIARAIHDLGPRREGNFVIVNCARVEETAFENTGGDTLYLDDVGALSPGVQAALLHAVETGDSRILAATSRDLRVEADAGRFRRDLLSRLNAVELHVPPLRERREDIPYLTAAFVKEFSGRSGRQIGGLSPRAEQILMSGTWPGNVRQLRAVLEQACMLTEGHVLTERDLRGMMASVSEASPATQPPAGPAPSAAQDLEQVERDHIARVLADVKGNKQQAARRLGISRRTLYRRLERHRLAPIVPA